MQKIPQTGDIIELESMTLRVVEMVGQRIAKVKMEKTEPGKETGENVVY